MPKWTMTFPHTLGQAEATRRIQQVGENIKAKHEGQYSDLQETWNGSTGDISVKAMGFKVSARFDVTDTAVDVEADVPMMATPFKGQIEQMLREEATRILA
jgi:hypothetical protein